MTSKNKVKKILWIGATSALARTYFDTQHEKQLKETKNDIQWILLGLEPTCPKWISSLPNCIYYSLDLTTLSEHLNDDDDDDNGSRKANKDKANMDWSQQSEISQIVISIRPALVTSLNIKQLGGYCSKMLRGLDQLLSTILSSKCHNVKLILHISSIAAVGHLQPQIQQSETSPKEPKNSSELQQPYDRFKKACEELVERKCTTTTTTTIIEPIEYTSIRLGALFSNEFHCIQCSAMQIQLATLGPFLPTKIDCNSSANVSYLIRLLLSSQHGKNKKALKPIYYSTRPIKFHPQPIPYGDYYYAYRQAYGWNTKFCLVPLWFVTFFVKLFHIVSIGLGSFIPFMSSIDYLLQVTQDEHSFDLNSIQQDFPQLLDHEESILECFQRRRATLKQR